MVGDPDLNTSYKIIDNLIKSGSDIIELELPFSDPSADGKNYSSSSSKCS